MSENPRGELVGTDPLDAAGMIAKFCDEYPKMRGLDPELVYGLHRGDDSACEITISGLRALVSEVESLRAENADLRSQLTDEINVNQALVSRLAKY